MAREIQFENDLVNTYKQYYDTRWKDEDTTIYIKSSEDPKENRVWIEVKSETNKEKKCNIAMEFLFRGHEIEERLQSIANIRKGQQCNYKGIIENLGTLLYTIKFNYSFEGVNLSQRQLVDITINSIGEIIDEIARKNINKI